MASFGRSSRRSRQQQPATAIPSLSSAPTADPRFAVRDEDVVYAGPPALAPAGLPLAYSTAPTGTLMIRRVLDICPGYIPPPSCLRLEYRIPPGVQSQHHPNPGTAYPKTTRYAYLPHNDDGCKLLVRFKVAWNYGYMFKIGVSLTSGLDNQVCWTTIPNKTSLQGGPFGFPDTNYVTNANMELDRLGIPSADQCLALLTNNAAAAAARPPAQNPSFVPTAAASGFSFGSSAAAAPVPPQPSLAPTAPAFFGGGFSNSFASSSSNDTTVPPETITYTAPNSLAIAITPDLFETVTNHDDDCAICFEKVGSQQAVKIKGCSHEFHWVCLQQSLAHNPRCPTCRKPLDCARGKSPSGTMTIEATNQNCPGFGRGVKSIQITYSIPGGTQKDFHENPRQRYSGTSRVAYLPNTPEGRQLLQRLKHAFRHGLTFRVGRSLTTGAHNQVTWTSIHHKTSLSG